MQALVCDVPRAFIKLGIAIVANNPIRPTTIMISTKVNPAVQVALLACLALDDDALLRIVEILIFMSFFTFANRTSFSAFKVPSFRVTFKKRKGRESLPGLFDE